MKKVFLCSLCHNGILGGGLYLDPQAVTFVCQKLTVDKRYRNIVLSLEEIREIAWKRVIFPVATFSMKTGDAFSFIIFNKRRFQKYYLQYSASARNDHCGR